MTPNPRESARLLRALAESPEEPSAFDSDWLAVLDDYDRLHSQVEAVLTLADDLDETAAEARRDQSRAHASEIHELITIADEFPKIAAQIRAALDAPPDTTPQPDARPLCSRCGHSAREHNAGGCVSCDCSLPHGGY
mgnify:CR=1 FL=1